MPDCCSIEPQGCGGAADASTVTYTPAVPGNWSPVPSDVGAALDQEAARIAALEAVVVLPQIYSCPGGVAVRQLVYQSGDSAADLADASNPSKMRAIGVVASKPDGTHCVIQTAGELGGFTGRTPKAKQYADPASPGGITETMPDPLVNQIQEVGYAKSASIIVFTIIGNPPIPV